jgi:hypothetical protein
MRRRRERRQRGAAIIGQVAGLLGGECHGERRVTLSLQQDNPELAAAAGRDIVIRLSDCADGLKSDGAKNKYTKWRI